VDRLAARVPPGTRGKGLLERMATPLRGRYIGNANVFGEQDVDLLTRYGGGSAHDVTGPLYDQAAEAALDDVATMQFIDINTWLPGDVLVKADRASMAHGLELRTPFLDREVMTVAARLARAEKTAAQTTKFALREAVGTLLPIEAVDGAKRGFSVPIGQWFRGELSGFAEQVLLDARTEEWLDKRAVLDVLRRFRAGDPEVPWRQVWVLVVFSLWHQIYVERVFDPVALGWQSSRPAGRAGRLQLPAGQGAGPVGQGGHDGGPAAHPAQPLRQHPPAIQPAQPPRQPQPQPRFDPAPQAAAPKPAAPQPRFEPRRPD
jgi:asparagine synthase (glutamine-hydrolysing)